MEPHIPGDGAGDRSRAKRKFKRAINKRGDHVDTDRLQHDYEEREKCPVGVLAHGEVCPPRLNRNQERNYCPYQRRAIQLHFCPGQYETAQP